ncbi:MAG: ferrous iron transport protein B [Armatimonadetes bacterium]|nr:ferrous iron transport protein B [Armatimonadota bacterium]
MSSCHSHAASRQRLSGAAEPSNGAEAPDRPRYIALVGNPNAGKTTVFNALTGMRQKVANYPGVTIEKKEGRCRTSSGRQVILLDLPGTYSLESRSPDEDIVRDVLLGLQEETPRPDMVVVIVDSSNLERNLYLVTQVAELGLPVIIALNMLDLAESYGREVNVNLLHQRLGMPVVPLVARKGRGVDKLRQYLDDYPRDVEWRIPLPAAIQTEKESLAAGLSQSLGVDLHLADALALRMLSNEELAKKVERRWGHNWQPRVAAARRRLADEGVALSSDEPTTRYHWITDLCEDVMSVPSHEVKTLTERVDRVLTHRFFGPLIFLALMAFVFQSIYTWAQLPMALVESGVTHLGRFVSAVLPEGPLASLLVDGVIAGVGAVVVFLPQILFLFLFLAVLDDSGYLARAAFIMDKLMSSVGLHGRSFIPLMSSFACAIPGIMATRTIDNRRDRLLTILLAPLMSCSARLPVYTLMIAAFIPNTRVWGFFRLPGLALLSMYLLGILMATAVGWLFRQTLFPGKPAPFLMELPPYRSPALRNVAITMWEQGWQFLSRAGTIILSISIVLWFLASYPHYRPKPGESPAAVAGAQIRHSYAGRLGRLIEPVVQPLGFDWKIGIGLVGSFAAREVLISTLSTVYNVGNADESSVTLREALRRERRPDGRPVYTPLVAVCLMVYFVLAFQCVSTLAVVKRETNSWGWPLFMMGYLTTLAYVVTFALYQVGKAMGWG